MAKIRSRRFLGAGKPCDNFAAYVRHGRFRFLLLVMVVGVLLFWTDLWSPLQQQQQELLMLQQTQPQLQLQKRGHKARETTTSLLPPPSSKNHNEPNKSNPKPSANKRHRRHHRLAAQDPREARSIVQPFDDFIHKDPLAGDVVAGPDDDALGKDKEEQGDDLVEEGNGLDDDRNVPAMVHGGLDAWITRDDDDWQTQRKKKKLLEAAVDSLDLRKEARLGVVVMRGERIDELDSNKDSP